MIGFALGLLYSNAGEWLLHKHVLHGKRLGKKKGTYWSFHFHEHHRNARKAGMVDPDYGRSFWPLNAQSKEVLGLASLAAVHAPLLPVAPGFTLGVLYSIGHYYRVHKQSHKDPEWAREHLTWHYDHHMGPDQDCNWCVSRPWFDHVMGTRVPYAFTEREQKDRERMAAREERRQQQAA